MRGLSGVSAVRVVEVRVCLNVNVAVTLPGRSTEVVTVSANSPTDDRVNSPTAPARLLSLHDILGGIRSPCVRTPWVVPWVADWRAFRSKPNIS